jgi:hypothetical protein
MTATMTGRSIFPIYHADLPRIVDCNGDRWELLRDLTLLGFASANPLNQVESQS